MTAHPTPPQPAQGFVTLVVSADRVRLVLSGELDLLIKEQLLDAVGEAVRHELPVDVDVSAVTFMDSSALATLSRLIPAASHRPTFINPPPMVRFLLEVTRIGELVDVVERQDGQSAAPMPAGQVSPGPLPA